VGPDDPLFPPTRVEVGESGCFEIAGLSRTHWKDAAAIRKIFKEAFKNAGLPYFNPHSFRHTLGGLGQKICRTPEDFKAWSQNMGHAQVLTTLTSYGAVAQHRQMRFWRNWPALDIATMNPWAGRPRCWLNPIGWTVLRR
jgi:integrase